MSHILIWFSYLIRSVQDYYFIYISLNIVNSVIVNTDFATYFYIRNNRVKAYEFVMYNNLPIICVPVYQYFDIKSKIYILENLRQLDYWRRIEKYLWW